MDSPTAIGSPEVIRLFPTFVWKARLAGAARDAVDEALRAALGELRAGLADPGPGEVWQSRHGLHELPGLAPLTAALTASVERVHEFLRLVPAPFAITGCWANVAGPGAAIRTHAHPNNTLSGVYYVQVPPGAGTINFHDPRPQAMVIRPPVTELTAYNTDQVVVAVDDGTLVIFPAWLPHSVDANPSDRLRISVSFNVMFTPFAETMSRPLWGET